MKFSEFGKQYTANSGIVDLMADLGEAMHSNPDLIFMGGGNPARIEQVETLYKNNLVKLLQEEGGAYRILGKYQSPEGDEELRQQLADLLQAEYGWKVAKKNIAVTSGGQSAFFVLSNLMAGSFADGSIRKIQFPLVPEYLGYADAGHEKDFFTATRPAIEIIDEHLFKYHVNFDELQITDQTAALCVSRPTNPTGNVLTDEEVLKLDKLCRQKDIPLIIDGAYGTPFPNIIFNAVNPHWNENTILLLSMSKLGLPGVRTGFIVANEDVIQAFASANTIFNLASGNIGPAIAESLFPQREILRISKEIIMPYYREKAMTALDLFIEGLGDLPVYVHKPEGAIFLWLWMKNLPIHSQQLYELLRRAGVLVIPGHNSFAGLDKEWAHTHECIRISYAQDEIKVRQGIEIICRELKKLYQA